MNRALRWYDYITINIYFLGLSALSQTMTPLVVPLLVQAFVGEALKGSYYGTLRLWTLMTALLVQSLMGMISDHSSFRWGRRRPFIFIGTIGIIITLILVGFTANLNGFSGYWILFALIILQMVASNTGHGAQQGLIPDLVPEENRGICSGIKAILEVPLPVIIVSMTIAKMVSAGNLWGGLLVLIVILVVTMGITMLVPEQKPDKATEKLNWKPFLRLLLMTASFTVVILGMGELVKYTGKFAISINGSSFVFLLGFVGVLAMGISVVAGVWVSTRIGLGDEIKKHPSFTWWIINRLSFLVGSTGLVSFMVYFMQGRFGFKGEEAAGPAANLTMVVGVFILLSALPSGWLSDRFGRKLMVAISGILAATGTLVVILSTSMTLMYVGGILVGIATGFFYSVNWALGTQIVPKEQAGRFLGISNLAGAGAGAIGAYIGGPIADNLTALAPDSPGLGYLVLFIIYGILFILSVLTLKGVKEKV